MNTPTTRLRTDRVWWQSPPAFYALYTVLFAGLCALVFLPFFLSGKSFVWYIDGNYQHLNAFIYLGSYLRERIYELFGTGTMTLPMWEFGIGYGGDMINTLSYYVLGDPFSLVSVVTPAEAAETVYGLLMLLRLYVAGLTFCAFCRKMECERSATLIAMLMYVFCGYALYSAIRHPYFVTPMMVWPLMLIGAEKLLRKERPTVFILAVFLAAVSNFYFFYMEVLLTICYVVFRFFSVPENRHIKVALREIGRFMGFALIGVAMAGVLLVPSLITVLTDARADTDYTFPLFYSLKEYTSLPAGFFSYASPVYWAYISISPIALLGVGALFLRRRQDGWLKGLLLLFLLFLCLPVFGYVLNGFGYVSGRWVWGLALLLAFIFAKTFPQLTKLPSKQRYALCLAVAAYLAVTLMFEHNRYAAVLIGCVTLLLGTLVLCGAPPFRRLSLWRVSISRRRVMQVAALVLAAVGVLQMRTARYEDVNYVSEFRGEGTALSYLQNDHAAVWDLIDDEGFYRIDSALGGNDQYNYLLTEGQSTTFSYWSLQNPHLLEYMRLNSTYSAQQNILRGMQSRSLLLPFASARYYTCLEGQQHTVPYGYTYVGSAVRLTELFDETDGQTAEEYATENTVHLYRSNLALPLGYTCDAVLDAETYASLSQTQRQQAMLQGAVIQNEDLEAVSLPRATVKDTSETLSYTVKSTEDIEVTDNAIIVHKAGASVTLAAAIPAERELYVSLTGLYFEEVSPRERYTDEEWARLTEKQKRDVEKAELYFVETDRPRITAVCGKSAAAVTRYAPTHIHSHNRTDYLMNLHYADKARSAVRLTFSNAGVYSFEKLSLIAQPMDVLKPAVAAMTADTLKDVVIDTNRIRGTITLTEDKLLCLSVPCSSGWTLMVDGKETDILRTNIAYMGVMLGAGEHTVELTYRTPYLSLGILISVLGLAAFIAVQLWLYRKRKLSSEA